MIMQILFNFLMPLIYLVMAYSFLSKWLIVFEQDTDMNEQERQLSFVLLALITVLWPVAVPISYLELLNKVSKQPS